MGDSQYCRLDDELKPKIRLKQLLLFIVNQPRGGCEMNLFT